MINNINKNINKENIKNEGSCRYKTSNRLYITKDKNKGW